jgi:hypothetical protein
MAAMERATADEAEVAKHSIDNTIGPFGETVALSIILSWTAHELSE